MSDVSLDIERLVRVPGVLDGSGGFDLAPDGRRVALSWNISGQWELRVSRLSNTNAELD